MHSPPQEGAGGRPQWEEVLPVGWLQPSGCHHISTRTLLSKQRTLYITKHFHKDLKLDPLTGCSLGQVKLVPYLRHIGTRTIKRYQTPAVCQSRGKAVET